MWRAASHGWRRRCAPIDGPRDPLQDHSVGTHLMDPWYREAVSPGVVHDPGLALGLAADAQEGAVAEIRDV